MDDQVKVTKGLTRQLRAGTRSKNGDDGCPSNGGEPNPHISYSRELSRLRSQAHSPTKIVGAPPARRYFLVRARPKIPASRRRSNASPISFLSQVAPHHPRRPKAKLEAASPAALWHFLTHNIVKTCVAWPKINKNVQTRWKSEAHRMSETVICIMNIHYIVYVYVLSARDGTASRAMAHSAFATRSLIAG